MSLFYPEERSLLKKIIILHDGPFYKFISTRRENQHLHLLDNRCREVAISLLSCYELISLVCTLLGSETCVVIAHFAEVILRVIGAQKCRTVRRCTYVRAREIVKSMWTSRALRKTIHRRANKSRSPSQAVPAALSWSDPRHPDFSVRFITPRLLFATASFVLHHA